jgi:hypothetical protein
MSAPGSCAPARRREIPGSLRGRCEVDGSPRDCRIFKLTDETGFVESFVPAVEGSKVLLEVLLPNGHPVLASGVVSGHEFKSGFDVVFTGISANDREQINRLAAEA